MDQMEKAPPTGTVPAPRPYTESSTWAVDTD
jgi:hypothetical protein